MNLLAFYHECRSPIGYATHHLFYGTRSRKGKEKAVSLENDSEKILEQAQSAVERDFTKHKIGMVLKLFQGKKPLLCLEFNTFKKVQPFSAQIIADTD